MKLRWTETARSELKRLRKFSEERWGREVTIRYLDDIVAAAKDAARNPDDLRQLNGKFDIKRVRSHYLVFAVDRVNKQIAVVRLLHTSMDVTRHVPS